MGARGCACVCVRACGFGPTERPAASAPTGDAHCRCSEHSVRGDDARTHEGHRPATFVRLRSQHQHARVHARGERGRRAFGVRKQRRVVERPLRRRIGVPLRQRQVVRQRLRARARSGAHAQSAHTHPLACALALASNHTACTRARAARRHDSGHARVRVVLNGRACTFQLRCTSKSVERYPTPSNALSAAAAQNRSATPRPTESWRRGAPARRRPAPPALTIGSASAASADPSPARPPAAPRKPCGTTLLCRLETVRVGTGAIAITPVRPHAEVTTHACAYTGARAKARAHAQRGPQSEQQKSITARPSLDRARARASAAAGAGAARPEAAARAARGAALSASSVRGASRMPRAAACRAQARTGETHGGEGGVGHAVPPELAAPGRGPVAAVHLIPL